MEFAYYWMDGEGIQHVTLDRGEADKAMHNGFMVILQPIDKRNKDGTNRVAG